jgi:PAS domain S-box-containing protein
LWQGPGGETLSTDFRALLEDTDDYIFFKDRNHVFTRVSRNISLPQGESGEYVSALGLTDYDVFPEKYADIYYRLEKEVFAGVPVASEIHEAQTPDGSLTWLDNHKYPIRNEDGEIVGLIGVVRDITEQKKAQLALAEREREYRAIFDGSVEGIVRVTIGGRVLLANEAAAAILGYDSVDDAISAINDAGRDVWLDASEREAYLRKLIGSEDHTIVGFECRLKRKDGNGLWILLNGKLSYGSDGEPAYVDVFLSISRSASKPRRYCVRVRSHFGRRRRLPASGAISEISVPVTGQAQRHWTNSSESTRTTCAPRMDGLRWSIPTITK